MRWNFGKRDNTSCSVSSVSEEIVHKKVKKKGGETQRESNDEKADVTMTHSQRRSASGLSVEA